MLLMNELNARSKMSLTNKSNVCLKMSLRSELNVQADTLVAVCSKISLTNEINVARSKAPVLEGILVVIHLDQSLVDVFRMATLGQVKVLAATSPGVSLANESEVVVLGQMEASVVVHSKISLTNELNMVWSGAPASESTGVSAVMCLKVSSTNESEMVVSGRIKPSAAVHSKMSLMSKFNMWADASIVVRPKMSLADELNVVLSKAPVLEETWW